MVKAKRKGDNFERSVRKLLEKNGYFVIRSAGSKGIFDLGVVRDGYFVGIQCKVSKNYNMRITKDELKRMLYAWYSFGIRPFVAYKKRNGKNTIVYGYDILDDKHAPLIELLNDYFVKLALRM